MPLPAKFLNHKTMEGKSKETVTAFFPGIGKVEISTERAEQIRRLQKMIHEQRAKANTN